MHAHTAARPLGRELAREADDAALRRRVSRLGDLPNTHESPDRSDVDDAPAAAVDHRARRRARQLERRDEVQLDGRAEVLGALVERGHRFARARIVDDDVDAAVVVERGGDQRFWRAVGSEVAGHRVRVAATPTRAQSSRSALRAATTTRAPAADEHAREPVTEAAARAGDQCDASVEPERLRGIREHGPECTEQCQTAGMTTAIHDFRVAVAPAVLDDLRDRLARTRWTDQIPGSGWGYGTDLEYLRDLCETWRTTFDWARAGSAVQPLAARHHRDRRPAGALHPRALARARRVAARDHPRLAGIGVRVPRHHRTVARPACARRRSRRRVPRRVPVDARLRVVGPDARDRVGTSAASRRRGRC